MVSGDDVWEWRDDRRYHTQLIELFCSFSVIEIQVQKLAASSHLCRALQEKYLTREPLIIELTTLKEICTLSFENLVLPQFCLKSRPKSWLYATSLNEQCFFFFFKLVISFVSCSCNCSSRGWLCCLVLEEALENHAKEQGRTAATKFPSTSTPSSGNEKMSEKTLLAFRVNSYTSATHFRK